jgi:hypothetical protein
MTIIDPTEVHLNGQRLQLMLAMVRHQYADLLCAARAAVVSAARGDPDPLYWIVEELRAHGQLPPPGGSAGQVAAAVQPIVAV